MSTSKTPAENTELVAKTELSADCKQVKRYYPYTFDRLIEFRVLLRENGHDAHFVSVLSKRFIKDQGIRNRKDISDLLTAVEFEDAGR